jgi:hypothetical protein
MAACSLIPGHSETEAVLVGDAGKTWEITHLSSEVQAFAGPELITVGTLELDDAGRFVFDAPEGTASGNGTVEMMIEMVIDGEITAIPWTAPFVYRVPDDGQLTLSYPGVPDEVITWSGDASAMTWTSTVEHTRKRHLRTYTLREVP